MVLSIKIKKSPIDYNEGIFIVFEVSNYYSDHCARK